MPAATPIQLPFRGPSHICPTKVTKSQTSENSKRSPVLEHRTSLNPVRRVSPYPSRPRNLMKPTIAVVNASGRQAASFIRVASAVGYKVRAQLRNLDGIVANEIAALPNVTVLVGDLSTSSLKDGKRHHVVNTALIKELFEGVQLAFINTTFYGNEVAIGCALADAAKAVHIQHYIYSSMPDHSASNPKWPSLPLWSSKFEIERHVRSLAIPATFVYTGIYNNNFTSLTYPLFCMALQPDGSFVWQAPFHPHAKLPWLDAEHDVGAAVLQLIKNGPPKSRAAQRVTLAFEMLSPTEACAAFARGVGRAVRYVRGPIEVHVQIPQGYRDQLEALEALFIAARDPTEQPPYFGEAALESQCPAEAVRLWEGYRSLEEYAREVFPLEEAANGLVWMNDEESSGGEREELSTLLEKDDDEEADDDSDVLTMGKRREEEWLA